jgi:putative aldouronate transport system substrate-binding protein
MLLVFVMLAGVFTGCKKEEQVSTGPRKLTVGIPQDATIADYDSNGLAEYLKEITGIEIEWELFASGSSNYAQQLTLMCSSGEELPDVLIGFNDLGHYSVNQYGEDGYIIDLTDLIEEHAPNYQKALSELPKERQEYIKEKGTNTTDGAFYAMPFVGLEAIDDIQNLVYINQTWLDTLGLQKPSNVTELYNVLKAFATQDPNGNGKADEIPMLGSLTNWLINAYVEYDAGNFSVTDGKVWDPVTTDEWRQGVAFVNSLVEEGLYNELSFTASQNEMKSLISPSSGDMRVGMFAKHHEIMTNATTDALNHYTAIGPLADETGLGGYNIVNEPFVKWGAMITENCKNPELAMEFLDAFYLDETVTRQRHGVKDLDWEYVEGTNSYGSASYTKVLNIEASSDGSLNRTLGNLLGILTPWNYLPIDEGNEGSETNRIAQAARLQREQWEIRNNEGKQREGILDSLVYTAEEYEAREDKAGTVSSYISEQAVLFATGEKDINDDNVWKEFKTNLETLGRDELMEIAQSAYDRKIDK